MNAQAAIQKLLSERLAQAQSKNPKVSIRSFSIRVGVHFAALSSILSGKRNVSRKLAERIADRLYLDPQERSELLSLFPEPASRRRRALTEGEVLQPGYLLLNAQQFRVVAEWEHFAVLSLLQCSDFRSEIAWISNRLGITETRSAQVVSRLIELDLLSMDPEGRLTRSEKNYRTPDDVSDISLKKGNAETLDLARESLYRDSIEDRDFTTVTVAIDPKKLRTAKEMIRKFQDDLCDGLEDGTRTEVYRLSVQLFPLTKLKKESPHAFEKK